MQLTRSKFQSEKVLEVNRLRSLLQGRNLDLLLVAGCSCLLTLLFHPVVDVVTAPTANAAPVMQVVTNLPAIAGHGDTKSRQPSPQLRSAV